MKLKINIEEALHNNSFNNDCNGQLSLSLSPLPKSVINQLGGKRAITGMACNPVSLL